MLTGWKGHAIRHTRFLPIESLVTSMKNGRNSIMRWDNIGFIYSILANKNPDFTIIREEMPRLESTSSSLVCGAGAASGVVGEPEISAEEITQLWKNIQIKLGILYRLMRSKNAIDPSFQGTENALSLAIKQKAPTYKASLKQQLESFLAQIEERTRTLSGKSGVRVAD